MFGYEKENCGIGVVRALNDDMKKEKRTTHREGRKGVFVL